MFLSRVGSTFKNAEQMSVAEIDSTWSNLQQGFRQILAGDATSLSFEELYRSSYNMIIHKHGSKLYDGLKDAIRVHLADRVALLSVIKPGDAFLSSLSREWVHHNKVMGTLRDVLMYVDRNFVTQFNKAPTLDVGLRQFQDIVLLDPRVRGKLVEALMDSVDASRQSADSDTEIVRSVLSIFHLTSRGKDCTDLWSSALVPSHLARAEMYYKNFAKGAFEKFSPNDYVAVATQSYAFEGKLLQGFPLIGDKTSLVLDRSFIDPFYERIIGAVFVSDVKNDDQKSVKSCYQLFSRTEPARRYMLGLFKEFVLALFVPPFVVAEIVEKIAQISAMCKQCLGHEFGLELQSQLESVFSVTNEICQKLSEFLDDAVKQETRAGAADGGTLGTKFAEALTVFRFVNSKDAFEAYYRFHLGRRLLSGKSDLSVEQSVAQKLRQECGQSYTAKIDGMLADVLSSGDLIAVWRQHDRATAEVFEARILTTSVWSNLKIVDLRITDQMRQSLDVFGTFYATRFSGRRLTWVHSQGSVDLKYVTGGSIVVLSVSTIQAVILLLFNDKNDLSLEEMLKISNLDLPEAKRHLLSLFVNPKCRLLIKSTTGTQLEMNDTFSLNADFETKSRHVKVPLLVDNSAPEVTGGSTGDIDTGAGLEQVVQEDRKHLIEAAIVRVMKLKRQLDHNGLVVEVANHLGNRFIPSVQMIKERVENLIDREFIARDNDDVKLYYYVA